MSDNMKRLTYLFYPDQHSNGWQRLGRRLRFFAPHLQRVLVVHLLGRHSLSKTPSECDRLEVQMERTG